MKITKNTDGSYLAFERGPLRPIAVEAHTRKHARLACLTRLQQQIDEENVYVESMGGNDDGDVSV